MKSVMKKAFTLALALLLLMACALPVGAEAIDLTAFSIDTATDPDKIIITWADSADAVLRGEAEKGTPAAMTVACSFEAATVQYVTGSRTVSATLDTEKKEITFPLQGAGIYHILRAEEAPTLPQAEVAEIENDKLTFAMNFKAVEPSPEQLKYYGKWYADFELTLDTEATFNAKGGADGYLSGSYASWQNGAWIDVPEENYTLEANKTLRIMETAAAMQGEAGLRVTYNDIATFVKDFSCGIFFEDVFMVQNAGKTVKLELKMYNPADETENYVIGETYTFTIPDSDYVCWNTSTGELYTTVQAGTLAAKSGQTVQLLKDVTDDLSEVIVNVLAGVTLDLNGYELETTYLFSAGHVVDDSDTNTGVLKTASTVIRKDNRQLPIHNGEGYMFFDLIGFNTRLQSITGENGEPVARYVFQPLFEPVAHDVILKGEAVTGLDVFVRITWTSKSGEPRAADFSFLNENVMNVTGSYNAETGKYRRMYELLLPNAEDFTNIAFQAYVGSDTTVEHCSRTVIDPPADTTTVTSQEVTVTSSNASATVAKGTKLNGSTDETALTLQVSAVSDSAADVSLAQGEELKSVDVHVDGIAPDNTTPVTVTLPQFLAPGLNMGNVRLYHVENGETVEMTRVASQDDFTAHNQYWYDPVTGDVVLYMATFSEVAAVAEPAKWEGNFDYSWYTNAVALADGEATVDYVIANADQLAAFGAIVGGMDGQTRDSFEGKTVKLIADINLGDDEKNNVPNKIFYPIGYYNDAKSYEKVSGVSVTSGVYSFKGTFDGNGHTISNFYQNTWEMFGDYNDGYTGTPNHYKDAMGLFGYVVNGTVKNLTVDNFSSDGEFTPTGVIAAYAVNSTFENIAITDCNPRVYNTGNGGIVGIGGNSDDPDTYKLTFTNITIDNTNKITALWGSWDVACGGLVGMFR